jgi:hypothetical protein
MPVTAKPYMNGTRRLTTIIADFAAALSYTVDTLDLRWLMRMAVLFVAARLSCKRRPIVLFTVYLFNVSSCLHAAVMPKMGLLGAVGGLFVVVIHQQAKESQDALVSKRCPPSHVQRFFYSNLGSPSYIFYLDFFSCRISIVDS